MSQIYLKNKQKSFEQKKEEQEEFSSTLFFLDVYECFCKW